MPFATASFASNDWKVTATSQIGRLAQINQRAKYFASVCKLDNMAYKLPDLFIDSLYDDELPLLKEILVEYRLQQRADFFWEEKRQ